MNDETAINEITINFFISYLVRIDSNIASTTSKSISTVATCVLYSDKLSINSRNIWYTQHFVDLRLELDLYFLDLNIKFYVNQFYLPVFGSS